MPHSTRRTKLGAPVLGLDVAKAEVVIHDGATGRTFTVANRAAELRKALRPFAHHDLAVCESTGGYERTVLDVALQIALPIHRGHPSQIRAFMRSHREAAKTDAIDAYWLARFALERGSSLQRHEATEPARQALADLVRHRQDLVARRTALKNRRSGPARDAANDLVEEELACIDRLIDKTDRRIADLIRDDAMIARDARTLAAIPGIGSITATTLLALMPELGRMNRRQAAALAGLAPHPRHSGTSLRGIGRMPARSGIKPTLFMAALTAARHNHALRTFYNRLLKAGKPKRLALNAVARKLVTIANAAIKQRLQLT